jgi:hypothetical protein
MHVAFMGHYWATSKVGRVSHTCPRKETGILVDPTLWLYVQCQRHMPCRLSHLHPHTPCAICPHTNPYTRTSPLSARPHVQCWRHIPYRVSQPRPHVPCATCPHTDLYVQQRGSALIPFVTPRPLTLHSLALLEAGPHTHSTLLTLSSPLRLKGSTQRCYGWRINAYKLAPPLLN